MQITLTRIDGGLHVSPAPPYLVKYLRYSHRSFKTVNYRRVNDFEERLLHTPDGSGGVYTLQGFFEKVCEMIHKHYDSFIVDDQRTPMPPVDWARIKKIGLRDYQIKPVIELFKNANNSGIINATGGWGKTIAQAVTYAAWSDLNTILAIPYKEVVVQTHKKFQTLFPDKHIGIYGNGHRDISKDITITTFKSLPSCAVEKCQLLLIDEIQATTGDIIQNVLTSATPVRIYGYTATDTGLFNQADKVITGLFGNRIIHIPYQEAQDSGAVVPGIVYFVETPNCIMSANTLEAKINHGIKRCKDRNQLVGKVASLVPEKWQTIVFVDHIKDHLIELYKYMPAGTKYVHREASKQKIGAYALTTKQQAEVVKQFCDNDFQFLIATDAFRAGVDVPNCRVVIQASGGSSEIEILQEAFRGSRILTQEYRDRLGVGEKTHFVLIDFLDNHDETLQGMAEKRMAIYKKQGWQIKKVRSPEEIDWSYHGNLATL